MCIIFFFFKQKTAYEITRRDWSSDVCSSDLVVASCGTALTPQQAQLLRRFTSKVVLSYDPDAAGQGAAARSCELLVREGFEVNVLVLDSGEDPDTFIRRRGADEYRARLRRSHPYLEYLRDRAAAGLDFGDP